MTTCAYQYVHTHMYMYSVSVHVIIQALCSTHLQLLVGTVKVIGRLTQLFDILQVGVALLHEHAQVEVHAA